MIEPAERGGPSTGERGALNRRALNRRAGGPHPDTVVLRRILLMALQGNGPGDEDRSSFSDTPMFSKPPFIFFLNITTKLFVSGF